MSKKLKIEILGRIVVVWQLLFDCVNIAEVDGLTETDQQSATISGNDDQNFTKLSLANSKRSLESHIEELRYTLNTYEYLNTELSGIVSGECLSYIFGVIALVRI